MAAVESLSMQVNWPERGSGFASGEQSWNSSSRLETSALVAHKKPLGPLCGANPVIKPIELLFPKYRRSPVSKILAEPAFPLTPLIPAILKPGDHQLQRSDSQPRFKARNKSRGMGSAKGASPFCSRMKSERV